jgi:hypothetical protein
MDGRTIFTLCAAALVIGLVPGSIVAQQSTLRQQLAGTWTYVSEEATSANGAKRPGPFADNSKGILILDASGQYAEVTGKSDRPKLKSFSLGDRSQTMAQELGTAAIDFHANYGSWSVNEGDKTLTLTFEVALVPNNEGIEVKATASVTGDELKLTVANVNGNKLDLVYRRAR